MSNKFTQLLFILILSVILVWPMGLVLGFEPVVVTITGPINGASFSIGENITFSGTAVGGTPPYSFVWDFGDRTTLAGPTVVKSYDTSGAKTVIVTSSDFEGVRATASVPLNIQAVTPLALVVIINQPPDNATFPVGQNINFSAAASGGTPPYSFVWDFGDGATLAGPTVVKSYDTSGAKMVTVRGTDFAGLNQSQTISLNIESTIPVGDDITAPSQPTIISSTITANATSTTGALTITWTGSTDPTVSTQTTSGLAGYSYILDHNANTTPNATVETTTTSLTQTLETGTWWFHLIAKDNAGNISTPVTNYGPMFVAIDNGTTTEPLTISNIRVTDVTYNSAIVRWTTNRIASSRIIYDTLSHPSIAGQTAPNFGYASSTATTDVDTKVVEHIVTVTDLLPSTAYYFRVISQ